ncbi:MAG: choice-of-anchor tandem repeat NxxGxxAF-containing protein [Phycisphaeraceae bacterium]
MRNTSSHTTKAIAPTDPSCRWSPFLWAALAPLVLVAAIVAPVEGISYNYQIIADQNDVIGGRTIGAIDQVALSNNGHIAFAGAINAGSGGIFTPTVLVVQTGDIIGGQTIVLTPKGPDVNDSGDIAFLARLDSTASGNDAILTATSVIANKDSVIDGRAISNIITSPHINNNGTIAFKAQTEGGGAGVYTQDSVLVHSDASGPFIALFGGNFGLNNNDVVAFEARDTTNTTGIGLSDGTFLAKTGDIFEGDPWGGVAVGGVEPVLNDNNVSAWFGKQNGTDVIFVSDGRVLGKLGDLVGTHTVAGPTDALAINNAAQVAHIVGFQSGGGSALMIDDSPVIFTSDVIQGLIVSLLTPTVAINNAGQVLFVGKVRPEGSPINTPTVSTLFLATPVPEGNFVASLTTGSPVTLTQNIDTPLVGPVNLEFDYLFETTTGQLDVLLDGMLLGTINAPVLPDTAFESASFLVDGSLLNLAGVNLTFLFDGPTGSHVLLDNVVLAGSTLQNGDFQSGSLNPWTITTTGAGTVLITPFTGVGVPEPGIAMLLLLGVVSVGMKRNRSSCR